MSHHRFSLRVFQSRRSSQSYCLFIYGGLFFPPCWLKRKKKIQKTGERDDKIRSKAVIQRGTWYGHICAHALMHTEKHTHSDTQTISLITSDRKAARGNGYSHGHFHCGALLALCPIYAFNTHTHKHTCVYIHIKMLSFSTHSHTHTHTSVQKQEQLHSCT